MAALLNPRRKVEGLWCTDSVFQKLEEEGITRESFFLAKNSKNTIQIVDKKVLNSLLKGEVPHQGIVLKAQTLPTEPLEFLKEAEAPNQIVLLLDHVTDSQNVGSILRLCLAFHVEALVMTRAHAPSENGGMAKSASGAFESVPRCIVSNLAEALRTLKSFGFWCVGLSEEATQPLRSLDLRGKIALVMGSEGEGLRPLTQDLCDFEAFLPTSSKFSTLSVTTATAIALYEAFLAKNPLSL